MDIKELADLATIIASILAVIALVYTALQIRQNRLNNQGKFWLELEKMFSRHDEVHINLRPGGIWAENDQGPQTALEWAKVEDYMGLFEHCEILIAKGLIDYETFKSIFSYRIYNILANREIVVGKLVENHQNWTDFYHLLDRLDIQVPDYE